MPKGPTLDPDERRMAIHVEDHPLEYFDFEGVIPRGEYGAGDAIVWDWGTFEPEAPTLDPVKAIRDGELKFRIEGQKLGGRFTIVRTGRPVGRSGPAGGREEGGDAWLLIHKKDSAAVAGWDAEDHPASVKTGRTNDEVKAGLAPRFEGSPPATEPPIDLSRAVAAPMPGSIEPMLATLTSDAFDDPDWLFEIKWDGYRVQAVVREGLVRMLTRNGNDAGTYFPNLLSPPDWIEAREAIVDGEVVALAPDGTPDFGLLQERIGVSYESGTVRRRPVGERSAGPAQAPPPVGGPRSPGAGTLGSPEPPVPPAPPAPLVYQAFDLLHLDGLSLLAVPLEERKRLLRRVLREHPRVRYASHVDAHRTSLPVRGPDSGTRGGRREAPSQPLRTRPSRVHVAEGQDPARAGVRRRRLPAGRGQRPRPWCRIDRLLR